MEEISKKVQESRLKWYGHVLRREEEYVGKRVMVMEMQGKRREEAQDRVQWRHLISIKKDRPDIKVGKDAEEEVLPV